MQTAASSVNQPLDSTISKITRLWLGRRHSSVVFVYHSAAVGSNPKHNIYAFSISIIDIVMRRGRKNKKRPGLALKTRLWSAMIEKPFLDFRLATYCIYVIGGPLTRARLRRQRHQRHQRSQHQHEPHELTRARTREEEAEAKNCKITLKTVEAVRLIEISLCGHVAASVTRIKSPNVYKCCPKMISLEN